ncbi:hypothetical protein NERG_01020 [Nematocida ausubeli]|uniref:Uncharacterized protein n=1 Tax=Nematocida ausubeli (strain ATCC PRA-371 / ERTm2) TaxID=1913371 RepID=H8ZBS1_NEMA1|nr:hypothetical protein NERG_01020 [Nematocida ausubeli]
MGKKQDIHTSVPRRAKCAVKQILDQALQKKGAQKEETDYSWISDEVKKLQTPGMRRDLLACMFKRINNWYEMQIDKNCSLQIGIFYLKITYFLYTLQFDSSIFPLCEDGTLLKVEMSYTIIESLSAEPLPKEMQEIISYLIYKNDLRIVLKWKEHMHLANPEIQQIEENIDSWFNSSPSINQEAMQEYMKLKHAYLVMQSLLK